MTKEIIPEEEKEVPLAMSEDEIINEEELTEEDKEKILRAKKVSFDFEAWKPKTRLGNMVKKGEIKDIDEILDSGMAIMETEIVDYLLPDMETDLLLIGQSRGKFGGGQRRVFKQTQKKTREGNKPQFATYAVIGNQNGYVGIGYGKAKETVPAREKAIRKAKLNLIKIRRGCGSWECDCGNPHTVPFTVKGKSGSVEMQLMSAPIGKGLVIQSECQKLMRLAGIKDVWSKTDGQTKTRNNVIMACFDALKKLVQVKVTASQADKAKIKEGKISG